MGLGDTAKKFLYNETIGEYPVDNDGNPVPALLFANSKNSESFGDMYLFSNFGIASGNTVTASSELTNNYMENNSQRQDHWAITPVVYTLTGYIGEVIYKPASNWSSWLEENVTNYLEPLSIISPTVSGYVQSAMNVVHQIEANYQKFSKYAENIVKSVNSIFGKNNMPLFANNAHQVFVALKALRDNRVLVDVYTPYGTFKQMAMTAITMSEDEKSKYKWSISVTLQEYREVETYTRLASDDEIKKLVQSEMLSQQASVEQNNGIASFIKTDGNKSLLKSVVQAFKG